MTESFAFEGEECWIDIHRGNISKFGMGVEYKVKIKYGEKIHKLSFRVPASSRCNEVANVWNNLVERTYADSNDIPIELFESARESVENRINTIKSLKI